MGADLFLCDPHRIIVTGPRLLRGKTARQPRHPVGHGADRRGARGAWTEPRRAARNRRARLRPAGGAAAGAGRAGRARRLAESRACAAAVAFASCSSSSSLEVATSATLAGSEPFTRRSELESQHLSGEARTAVASGDSATTRLRLRRRLRRRLDRLRRLRSGSSGERGGRLLTGGKMPSGMSAPGAAAAASGVGSGMSMSGAPLSRPTRNGCRSSARKSSTRTMRGVSVRMMSVSCVSLRVVREEAADDREVAQPGNAGQHRALVVANEAGEHVGLAVLQPDHGVDRAVAERRQIAEARARNAAHLDLARASDTSSS